MRITSVRVNLDLVKNTGRPNDNLIAFVSIVFDNRFAVGNIRIVRSETNGNILVSMPSRQTGGGQWRDVAYPITQEFRDYLDKMILDVVRKEMEKKGKTLEVSSD